MSAFCCRQDYLHKVSRPTNYA